MLGDAAGIEGHLHAAADGRQAPGDRRRGRLAARLRFPVSRFPIPVPDPPVTIQLNGERFEVPAPLTLDALLAQLEIDARRVAVELNEYVVKKAAYADTVVAEGDVVEVVNFVGGG